MVAFPVHPSPMIDERANGDSRPGRIGEHGSDAARSARSQACCIPTNAADDPFTVRILPRRSRGCLHLFDPHIPDSVLKTFAVDAITIPDQITRSRIPGKRFHNLLRRPCRSRMFGHIEMHDTPTLVSQYDEHEEHPEFRGWDSEEIACDDIFSVVLKECLPCGEGGGTSSGAVFLYR